MPESQIRTPPTKSIAATKTPDASKGMTLFVSIVATLYFGKEVLVPVTLALLLAFLLAPLIDFLRRIYLGRIPAVLIGVMVALSIISGIGGVIGSQIAELSTDMPNYAATVETKMAVINHYTIGQLTRLADSIGRHKDGSPSLSVVSTNLQTPSIQSQSLLHKDAPQGSSPLDLAERYLSPILAPLATLGIVFVVAVFALLQREDLRDRLIRLVGSDDLHRTTLAIDDAGRRLSRYFITQLSINTAFGTVIGIGLLIIGVPNPVLWGILATLLRFVPYVGSFIAAILPMALASAIEPGWTMMLWTAVLFLSVEGLTGQLIEPLIYGRSTGLSPFSVVVAAVFWSWLWGPIGLILSTPLTLCLVVMGRHIERLKFLDVMLGDQPALTPVESFYQRILAGDADEAQDQAERLLKDFSLSTYYDEVAIKGLELAANDAQRGALDGEQLDGIKSTIRTLIRGLERHSDKQPSAPKNSPDIPDLLEAEKTLQRNPDPASIVSSNENLPETWKSSGAILCIPGRGPLDDLPAAMLAQLMTKHGLSARIAGYAEVSRDQIESFDSSGVAMVCVCCLNLSGSPAHLRYLTQRLRGKLPQNTPILVGIWPANDPFFKDPTAASNINADYFITSLEQAVSACVSAAENSILRKV